MPSTARLGQGGFRNQHLPRRPALERKTPGQATKGLALRIGIGKADADHTSNILVLEPGQGAFGPAYTRSPVPWMGSLLGTRWFSFDHDQEATPREVWLASRPDTILLERGDFADRPGRAGLFDQSPSRPVACRPTSRIWLRFFQVPIPGLEPRRSGLARTVSGLRQGRRRPTDQAERGWLRFSQEPSPDLRRWVRLARVACSGAARIRGGAFPGRLVWDRITRWVRFSRRQHEARPPDRPSVAGRLGSSWKSRQAIAKADRAWQAGGPSSADRAADGNEPT